MDILLMVNYVNILIWDILSVIYHGHSRYVKLCQYLHMGYIVGNISWTFSLWWLIVTEWFSACILKAQWLTILSPTQLFCWRYHSLPLSQHYMDSTISEFRIIINSLWPSDAIWRQIWVNIGLGNGLLPDGTKPLSEPNVDWSSVKSSDIHIKAISQQMPQPSITKIRLKITYLKFSSNFPGANELTVAGVILHKMLPISYEFHFCFREGWVKVDCGSFLWICVREAYRYVTVLQLFVKASTVIWK